MWIKRRDYLSLVVAGAAQTKELELNKKAVLRQEAEVAYWREKFEQALNRADRLSDRIMEHVGGPVSDLGVTEQKFSDEKMDSLFKLAQQQNSEMFGDGQVGGELEIDQDLAKAVMDGLNG